MEEYGMDYFIQVYHVFPKIWNGTIGERLVCEQVFLNSKDRYRMAVKKDGIYVGLLPRKISHLLNLMLGSD